MAYEDIINRMDLSFKEEREEFFAVADSLSFQPKYKDYAEEVEKIKQEWRDIPQKSEYPNIDFPPSLPSWFPKVRFFSSWEKDKYIYDELMRIYFDKNKVIDFLKTLGDNPIAKSVMEYAVGFKT